MVQQRHLSSLARLPLGSNILENRTPCPRCRVGYASRVRVYTQNCGVQRDPTATRSVSYTNYTNTSSTIFSFKYAAPDMRDIMMRDNHSINNHVKTQVCRVIMIILSKSTTVLRRSVRTLEVGAWTLVLGAFLRFGRRRRIAVLHGARRPTEGLSLVVTPLKMRS